MMLTKIWRVTLWALFVTSLGFAWHLYPGPAAVANQTLASISPSDMKDSMGFSASQSEEFRASIRWMALRGWYVNLALFILGAGSSLLWLLLGSGKKWARYIATIGLALFVAIAFLTLAPSRLGDFDRWVKLLGTLSRIYTWSYSSATYLAWEIHRALTLALAAAVFVLLCVAAIRKPTPLPDS